MRLKWDLEPPFPRQYEVGVDQGVFYDSNGVGYSWNGLTAVSESEENSDQTLIYVDGQKVINRAVIGSFAATLEALTYPDEFLPYDGYSSPMFSGQARKLFGLCYRTMINEIDYKIHIVYNCLAKPTTRDNDALSDSMDVLAFSWGLSTMPVALPYNRPTAHFIIDSKSVYPRALEALTDILYGSEVGNDSRLPSISELLALFEATSIFLVVDNGDGTVTVTGPDGWVDQDLVDPTKWTLTSPTVIPLSDILYQVASF